MLARFMIVTTFLLLTPASGQDLPYVQENPDTFIKAAVQRGKPSVVLFNFNLSSG